MADLMDVFSCNRQPFLSEGGCDRGNVNIHQFDDLPYCDPIDPTPASIPPEIVDVLNVPVVPPPCACVSIDYSLKFKYSQAFKFKAEFKSVGDCCDGNYESDFDLELPCPIKKIGTRWYKHKLKWNKGDYYSQIYIQDDEDCGLNPLDIDFELGLKCPVRTNGDKTISIGIDWGAKKDKETHPYVKATNDDEDCAITPRDVDFDLTLPCPIPENTEDNLKINLGWQGNQSDSQPISIKKAEDCSLKVVAPEFDLGLPCPIPDKANGNIKIDLKWQDKQSDSQPISINKVGDCSLEVVAPEFELGLPCPITGVSKDVTISLGWNKQQSDTSQIKIKKKGDCEIDLETSDFDIGLTCPVPTASATFRPTIQYGHNFKFPQEVVLVSGNHAECETTFYDQPFDIEIPCPLDNLNFSGSITEGDAPSINITQTPGASCGLGVQIDIVVPKADGGGGGGGGGEGCGCIRAIDGDLEGCICADVAKLWEESESGVVRKYYLGSDFQFLSMKENGCCGGPPNDGAVHNTSEIWVIRVSTNEWKKYISTSTPPDRVYEEELVGFNYECGVPECPDSSPPPSSPGEEDICFKSIKGGGGDVEDGRGYCITFQTEEVCIKNGKLTREDGEDIKVCIPIGAHVNKCCGSGNDGEGGTGVE